MELHLWCVRIGQVPSLVDGNMGPLASSVKFGLTSHAAAYWSIASTKGASPLKVAGTELFAFIRPSKGTNLM